jgi:hypothetical protein
MLSITFVASAADATGKWAGETPGRNGNQPITFNLKASGAMLTGTITTAQGDRPIEDGKVTVDTITFRGHYSGPGRHSEQTDLHRQGRRGCDRVHA